MISIQKISLFLLILVELRIYSYGIRTKDKMYEKIEGSKACYRRLNATHQIGCSSKRGGSTGAVHFITQQEDLEFILTNGTGPPYIPILPTDLFNRANLDKCHHSGRISGMIIYPGPHPTHFTHENRCPNAQMGVDGTCGAGKPIWNPYGTGLLYEDIPFPLFYVENASRIATIRDCFEKFNNYSYDTHADRSLCSLELISFMYATTDTPTCIRRSNSVKNLNPVKFCDPLGDQNIYSTLFGLKKSDKYVMITARLDTTSMFDLTVGATAPITGLVALLSVAKRLKLMLNAISGVNVIFVLFSGETYDYIGSQRFVYDLENHKFPLFSKKIDFTSISIDDILLYIELSQLADTGDVIVHHLNDDSRITDFYNIMQKYKDDLSLDKSLGTLPPSSLHSFIKKSRNFPGILIANHRNGYSNHYYNAIYDDATNIRFVRNETGIGSVQHFISHISQMVALSVYEQLTHKTYNGSIIDDKDLIDELFYCYLENPDCRVHHSVQKSKLPTHPLSLYVGVELIPNYFTTLVGLTLAWMTGDVVGESDANCKNTPETSINHWRFYNFSTNFDDLNHTQCFKTTMNFTEAISPAFVIQNYNWSSGEYSTWSESTWGDLSVRLFLRPSHAHETLTLTVGSLVFILSFVCIYFVKNRSDVLFPVGIPSALSPTDC